MPVNVNHQARRLAIAGIVADIIASKGLDGVTIRNVAAAAGYSTTIVTHYFSGKYDLLKHSHQVAAAHAQKRVHAVLARDPTDLQGCLEALLPLTKASLRDWKIYFAFWQVATFDAEFTEQEKRSAQHARDLIAITLDARREAGLLPADSDIPALARRLLTIIQGIATQAIVDGVEWSPARQREFLASELRLVSLIGDP
ncbi:MAG: TetR/AcrR family transcriptional regulator [Pseudomonadota bacterium]|jgi:AcrR family transcriptional regulator|nr:TetR/AcrR family transcriptional regulator [Pseudomonadota bacterium]